MAYARLIDGLIVEPTTLAELKYCIDNYGIDKSIMVFEKLQMRHTNLALQENYSRYQQKLIAKYGHAFENSAKTPCSECLTTMVDRLWNNEPDMCRNCRDNIVVGSDEPFSELFRKDNGRCDCDECLADYHYNSDIYDED